MSTMLPTRPNFFLTSVFLTLCNSINLSIAHAGDCSATITQQVYQTHSSGQVTSVNSITSSNSSSSTAATNLWRCINSLAGSSSNASQGIARPSNCGFVSNSFFTDSEDLINDAQYSLCEAGGTLRYKLRVSGVPNNICRETRVNPTNLSHGGMQYEDLGIFGGYDYWEPTMPQDFYVSGTIDCDKDRAGWVGDLHSDGVLEKIWQDQNGQVKYLEGTTTTNISTPVGSAWTLTDIGDFNGDGFDDILWVHDNGTPHYWRMRHGKRLSGHNLGGWKVSGGWSIKGAGDINSDGYDDLIFRHTNGQVAYWRIVNGLPTGAGGFTGTASSLWSIEGVGDVNGDGVEDIVWQKNNGQVAYWKLQNASFVSTHNIFSPVSSVWTLWQVGDVDSDGTDDIIWRRQSGDTVHYWPMENGVRQGGINISGHQFDGHYQELDSIARRAAEIAADMCPNGIENCNFGRTFYQFIDVDSLGVHIDQSWWRKVLGMRKAHPNDGRCIVNLQNGTVENTCYNSAGAPNQNTLFDEVEEFTKGDFDYTDHYTWGIFHYAERFEFNDPRWDTHSTSTVRYEIPLLMPPQSTNFNKSKFVGIDMRKHECWPQSGADDPWSSAPNTCRITVDLNDPDYHETNMAVQGMVFFLENGNDLSSYMLNSCQWKYPDGSVVALFGSTKTVDLGSPVLDCDYSAKTLQAIDFVYGSQDVARAEAYNLLTQGAWMAFSLFGGELIGLLEAGEDIALAARVVKLKEVYDAVSTSVNTTASLAMNLASIFDAAEEFEECRNSDHIRSCRAASLGSIALSSVFLGMDAATAKSTVQGFLPSGSVHNFSGTDLQTLLEDTRVEYQKITDRTVPSSERPPKKSLNDADIHNHSETTEQPNPHTHEEPTSSIDVQCPCPSGC